MTVFASYAHVDLVYLESFITGVLLWPCTMLFLGLGLESTGLVLAKMVLLTSLAGYTMYE